MGRQPTLLDARDHYESRLHQALEDGGLDPKTATAEDLDEAAGLLELLALDDGLALFNTKEMLADALAEAKKG
jgi:hypothetical protein